MERISVCIVLIALRNAGIEKVFENYLKQMDMDRFDIHFLTQRNSDPSRLAAFESRGYTVHQLSEAMGHRISASKIKEYDDFFAKHHFDIIHNNLPSCVLPLASASRYGTPVRILHSHGDYERSFANRSQFAKSLFKAGLRFNTSNATHLLACGNTAARTAFGEKIITQAKVTIVPNAIDTNNFRFNQDARDKMRAELGLNGAFVVGNVGRFDENKNHEFQLRVFAKLAQRDKNARLLLIGSGDLLGEMHTRATELGIAEKVIFQGAVPNTAPYLNAMDVFLFPSKHEGFSVATTEAQCCGLGGAMSDSLPPEMDIFGNLKSLPLDADIDCWVDALQQMGQVPRQDMSGRLRDAGFDIENQSLWLENYYMDCLSQA